jgi:predicted permease
MSAAISLPSGGYPGGADVRGFFVGTVDRLRRLPGVTPVGAATEQPLTVRERRAFTVENPSAEVARLPGIVANDWVMGDYFAAVGSRIVRGRALANTDTVTSEPVVVVNETLARRYWPGEDPVGRRLAWGNARAHGAWMRVVGVVADIKLAGLGAETEPETWQPWMQLPDATLGSPQVGIFRSMRLMIRADIPPATLIPALRREVQAIDPSLPVTDTRTLEEVVGASSAPQRFNATILGGFALAALLLAALGVGGVLAISVSRRRQEIGIRLALGSSRSGVVRMVVRLGMTLVAVGLAIGLPGALAAGRLLRALLFETAPHDPVAFAGAPLLLALVALCACAIPALAAGRVSPNVAFRMD